MKVQDQTEGQTCSHCDDLAVAHGLCSTHVQRMYRHGDPGTVLLQQNKGKICSVDECKNEAKTKGMCGKHYKAHQRAAAKAT